MSSTNAVCAVIVTYNRKELLWRNLSAVLRQSVPCDILIYDNASAEDTEQYLKERGLWDNGGEERKVYYHRAKENSGGAGGFSAGITMAGEYGYEYIWLMDDDGYCTDDNTLETLLYGLTEHEKKGRPVICNSIVLSENDPDMLAYSLFGTREAVELTRGGADYLYGEVASFNSTLFSSKLVRKIGTVDARLFIYGDDTDYLERAKRSGYDLVTVCGSRYSHPDSGMGNRRIFGRMVNLQEMSDERYYFYTRNYMYIMCRYRSKLQAFFHVPKVLLKSFLYPKRRFAKCKIAFRALRDGVALSKRTP